jgi:DEP domain-containing protein 5
MWQLKMSVQDTAVYVGKKISCLGVKAKVKSIYVQEEQVISTLNKRSSAVVTENTRMIFRSETAKFFIFIQMSKEMWEFNQNGEIIFEKCVNGFLPELFSKWKAIGASHVVSIVMFSRVFYQDPIDFLTMQSDGKGNYYKDFYNVIADV